MFDSGFGHRDLIFSDLTETLTLIPWADQNYTQWLGADFLQRVQTLKDVGTYGELGIYQPINGTA